VSAAAASQIHWERWALAYKPPTWAADVDGLWHLTYLPDSYLRVPGTVSIVISPERLEFPTVCWLSLFPQKHVRKPMRAPRNPVTKELLEEFLPCEECMALVDVLGVKGNSDLMAEWINTHPTHPSLAGFGKPVPIKYEPRLQKAIPLPAPAGEPLPGVKRILLVGASINVVANLRAKLEPYDLEIDHIPVDTSRKEPPISTDLVVFLTDHINHSLTDRFLKYVERKRIPYIRAKRKWPSLSRALALRGVIPESAVDPKTAVAESDEDDLPAVTIDTEAFLDNGEAVEVVTQEPPPAIEEAAPVLHVDQSMEAAAVAVSAAFSVDRVRSGDECRDILVARRLTNDMAGFAIGGSDSWISGMNNGRYPMTPEYVAFINRIERDSTYVTSIRVSYVLHTKTQELPAEMVGFRITYLRQCHGLLQRELAALLGASQATVSGWERGLAKPPPDKQIKLQEMEAELWEGPNPVQLITPVNEDINYSRSDVTGRGAVIPKILRRSEANIKTAPPEQLPLPPPPKYEEPPMPVLPVPELPAGLAPLPMLLADIQSAVDVLADDVALVDYWTKGLPPISVGKELADLLQLIEATSAKIREAKLEAKKHRT
jgi:transcriptional regulator with XRE-family HTH domain